MILHQVKTLCLPNICVLYYHLSSVTGGEPCLINAGKLNYAKNPSVMCSEGSATKDEPTSMEYPDALETDGRPSAVQGCYTSYLGIHDEAYYVLV